MDVRNPDPPIAAHSLMARLCAAASSHWHAYTTHPFVRGLADGSLPEPAFRHYLVQDYLFLVQFARAYGLAVYKSDTIDDMRSAAQSVATILNVEMDLHVRFCQQWGLSEVDMAAVPEDPACMAYTRFVLERGMAGDVLDLHVALAPCVVGYGVIGLNLARDPRTRLDGNPYASWIAMYSGDEYLDGARAALDQLERIGARRGAESRFGDLAKNFSAATRLEIGFWQMGLDAAAG